MSAWPKLVRDWDDKHPADLAVCQKCERTVRWDPVDGDPYDLCSKCPASVEPYPQTCGGQIVMAYMVGDTCDNCGTLDWSMPIQMQRLDTGSYHHDQYCSRVCQLQHEYARTLKVKA